MLNETQATSVGALAARCNYLSLGGPDVCFVAKKLCRSFAKPTRKDVGALRGGCRYLATNARLIYEYKITEPAVSMEAVVDPDFAGVSTYPQIRIWGRDNGGWASYEDVEQHTANHRPQ